ncbi:MAG: MIP/aquaporin family protein [Candidatus Nanopelagicales bacterium]|jgi:glycerol uptake facilitator protein
MIENFEVITINEFIGTAILVLIGCGIGALGSLPKSLGFGAGNWMLTAFGWGMAVFVGASVAWESGAHLNPAVTVALAMTDNTDWGLVPYYFLGEFAGAIVGGLLVYIMYKKQFDDHDELHTTGSIFYTKPGVRSLFWNTVSEAIASFVLVYWIIQQAPWQPSIEGAAPNLGNIGLGYAGVAFAVVAIGAGLGGATGYAINPARDLGPRIAYALLPLHGKEKIDWGYAWVPVIGPLIGGAAAALVYIVNY